MQNMILIAATAVDISRGQITSKVPGINLSLIKILFTPEWTSPLNGNFSFT